MAPSPMPSTAPMPPAGSPQHGTLHEERQHYTAAAFAMAAATVPVTFGTANTSTIRTATVEQCPVMGMADLGAAYYHVALQPGARHVPHLHPRAAELLLVTAGTVDVWFVDEGAGGTPPAPRLVRNTVAAAGAAVIPRGLLHGVACVGGSACAALSTLPDADPGVVLAAAAACGAPAADVAAAMGTSEADAAAVCGGVAPEVAPSQPAA